MSNAEIKNTVIKINAKPADAAKACQAKKIEANRADEFEIATYTVEAKGSGKGEITVSLGKFRPTGKGPTWRYAVRYRPEGRDYWNCSLCDGTLFDAITSVGNIEAGFGKWW